MTIPVADAFLIDRFRKGDSTAFEELFWLYHKPLYRFACTYAKDRQLAEEITQEAFVKLWLNREKIACDLALYPYLFTQVRRMTIDAFRKKVHADRYTDECKACLEIGVEQTAEKVQWNELNRITTAAISQLSEQQQQIFEMSRFQGLTYDEIAQQLHISKNTVKYHLVNALKNLRKTLAHYEIIGLLLTILFF